MPATFAQENRRNRIIEAAIRSPAATHGELSIRLGITRRAVSKLLSKARGTKLERLRTVKVLSLERDIAHGTI